MEKEEPNRYQELLEHTRADALAKMAEHFLATAGESPELQGLKGSERCQVVLHVDINTLRQHSGAGNPAQEHCHMDDKQWLSPQTARRLACDTSLITVLEDEEGRVLNIGRKSRTVPAHISRALGLRDKTCRFPGCCESRYVDAHHIHGTGPTAARPASTTWSPCAAITTVSCTRAVTASAWIKQRRGRS